MSRLTDILEAIPLCEVYMDGVDDGCNTCPYNGRCKDLVPDTIKMLEDLAKRVPRWISVHEALPGMDEKVLFIPACNPGSVYIGKLKYVGEVNAVYFVVNNWRRTVTYSATHWMPLPEPPEEDEHGKEDL